MPCGQVKKITPKGTSATFTSKLKKQAQEALVVFLPSAPLRTSSEGLTSPSATSTTGGIPQFFTKGYQALRGGGEYAHVTVSVGKKQNSYVFSWTKPYFCDTPWIVGFDVERSSNRARSDEYDISASSFVIHAKYPINQFLKVGVRYRLRDSEIKVASDASTRLKADARIGGTISAVSASLIYDSTNSIIKPTKGARSRLEVEYAGVGGEHSFWGLSYLNTFYQSASSKGVLKVRANFRYIIPTGSSSAFSIPLNERLFFRWRRIGTGVPTRYHWPCLSPRTRTTGRDLLNAVIVGILPSDPREGRRLHLHRYGTSDGEKKLNSGPFRASVGYGVRLTILGQGMPLTFGMGYPFNSRAQIDVKRFFFSVGGRF